MRPGFSLFYPPGERLPCAQAKKSPPFRRANEGRRHADRRSMILLLSAILPMGEAEIQLAGVAVVAGIVHGHAAAAQLDFLPGNLVHQFRVPVRQAEQVAGDVFAAAAGAFFHGGLLLDRLVCRRRTHIIAEIFESNPFGSFPSRSPTKQSSGLISCL